MADSLCAVSQFCVGVKRFTRSDGINQLCYVLNVYECVSVFLRQLSGMQTVSLLHRIMLSSLACMSVPYFPTLFHERHYKKKIGT